MLDTGCSMLDVLGKLKVKSVKLKVVEPLRGTYL